MTGQLEEQYNLRELIHPDIRSRKLRFPVRQKFCHWRITVLKPDTLLIKFTQLDVLGAERGGGGILETNIFGVRLSQDGGILGCALAARTASRPCRELGPRASIRLGPVAPKLPLSLRMPHPVIKPFMIVTINIIYVSMGLLSL